MSPEDISLYSGNSPQCSPRPCSISPCTDIGMLSPGMRESETMDDYNSQDSGYSASQKKCRRLFNFVQPIALPPKRIETPSPPKTPAPATSCFRSFNSLSSDSMESIDEDCMMLLDMEDMDDNAQLPTSFNTIINGNIKSCAESRTPVLRRCLSMTDGNVQRNQSSTPETMKTISEQASPYHSRITDSGSKTFKRPEPPSAGSPVQIKRLKSSNSEDDKENSPSMPVARPTFRKSVSMNDNLIMNALARCKYNR